YDGEIHVLRREQGAIVPAGVRADGPSGFHPTVVEDLPAAILETRNAFGQARVQDAAIVDGGETGVDHLLDFRKTWGDGHHLAAHVGQLTVDAHRDALRRGRALRRIPPAWDVGPGHGSGTPGHEQRQRHPETSPSW